MGWRGAVRSMAAASRRAERTRVRHARQSEREAARARRELLAHYQQMAAASELARAHYESQLFQNYLELIVSLHRDGWTKWDWVALANTPAPVPSRTREGAALHALQSYTPGVVDRTLGRDREIRARMESDVRAAREADAAEHQHELASWEWHARVGHGVLNGDLQAYLAVLDHLLPFDELDQLGVGVTVTAGAPWYVEAFVRVLDDQVVPNEDRKLTATGKITSKPMPKGTYWALYQDHVCSAALRVARELFALLPIRAALVHVAISSVSRSTGHDEVMPILSVQFDAERFASLALERVDASDAVQTFPHNMRFKKTSGFARIEHLAPAALMTSR